MSESVGNNGNSPGVTPDGYPLIPQAHGGALRKIPKGVSGNPAGRPKKLFTDSYTRLAKTTVPQTLREKLRKKGIELPEKAKMSDAVALGMTLAAINGYAPPAKEIADRVEGKVVEQVEMGGIGGGPVRMIVIDLTAEIKTP